MDSNWWDEDASVEPVASAQAPTPTAAPESEWWSQDETLDLKQNLTGGALGRGLSRNADLTGQFAGSALESVGGALGIESLEDYGRDMSVRNRAELAASTPSMTTEDINGLGSAGSFVAEKLGESATPMATSIAAAAAAGAVAGSVVPGLGTVAGALVGAGAATLANLPYMFGSMRERQKDADIAAGRKIEVDDQAALFAAVPASALDSVSDLFLIGKFGKFLKPLTENTGLFTRVISNAATGAMVEAPTELGQTMIERFQAGLSLTDEEAQAEYWEAAVAGGLVGGTVSGATSIPRPSVAPTLETITEAGPSQEQQSALGGVPPVTGGVTSNAPAAPQLSPEEMAAVARTMAQGMRAQQRTTPPPAPNQDLTPEQRAEAGQAQATELAPSVVSPPVPVPDAVVAPEVTPVGSVAPPAEEELSAEDLAATALTEQVTEQAASADEIKTVPEAPEQIEAQFAAMLEGGNARGVVFVPKDSDAPIPENLPRFIGKVKTKDGALYYNSNKDINGFRLNGGRVKVYDAEGRRNELLGLGEFNKEEVSELGPVNLGVVEKTPDGTAVKEVAATEATVPSQMESLEELAPEGNTVEVLPAEEVLEERAAAGASAIATSQARGKAQVVNKLSPEEQARIDEEYDEQAFKVKRAALDAEIAKAAEEVKTDRKEVILQKANRGELSAEEEITVRINEKQAKKNPKIAKGKLERFRAVTAFFAENIPTTPEAIRNMADATAVFERLKETVAKANKLGLRVLPKARVSDEMPNALAWLVQLNGFARKAEAFATATPGTRTEMMGELMDYLANEQILLATGDSTPIREERKRTADAIAAAKRGVEADTIAGVQSDESSEATTDEDEIAKIVRSDADEFSDDDAGDNLSAAESTVDETADEDTQDDDDFMQLGPDEVPIGEDGLPGRPRPTVEIEGEAFTAGANRTATVETRARKKVTLPGRINIRRGEGISSSEEKTQVREALEGMGLPFYDDMFDADIREEVSNGVQPEVVLAQDVTSLKELGEVLDSAEFQDALVNENKVLSKLQARLQKLVSGAIYNSIVNTVGDLRVYILSDADMDLVAGANANGYYQKDGDFIVVRESTLKNPNAMAHILVHEGAHATFEHVIRADAGLAGKIEFLRSLSEKHAAKVNFLGNEYGFKDVHEFMSEAFSNPVFQEFLSTVPLSYAQRFKLKPDDAKGGAIKTAMDFLRKTVGDILGIKAALQSAGYAPGTSSVLDVTMMISGRIIELAPQARADYYSTATTSTGSILPSEGDFAKGSTEAKLVKLGLTPDQAVAVAKVIDEELGGTATDAEINTLASYVQKPIASPAGLAGTNLPPLPPRVAKVVKSKPAPKPLPGRATKTPPAPPAGGKPPIGPRAAAALANVAPGPRDAPDATPTTAFKLYLTTLDFIDRMNNKYFKDAQGNALSDFTNAAYEFAKIVQDVAQVHDRDMADFEDLRKSDPKEAGKIAQLIAPLAGMDVNLGPGANNDHLKGNARRHIQAKANLPQLQADHADLSAEGRELFDRMAENYRESFNDYIQSVTYTILENLDVKLSNSDLMRIMQNVVDGKLTDTDRIAIGDDAVFEQLQKSEALRKKEGVYFPAQRFGDWVVTTQITVKDPGITSAVTKASKTTVPIKTEIDGGTVQFSFDHTVRGAQGAVALKVRAWVASHDLTMTTYRVKYRDRLTGEIVSKGEQDVTRDYDMVHEVKLQNEGVHFFEDRKVAGEFQKQANADVKAGVLTRTSVVLAKHTERERGVLINDAALDAVVRSFNKNGNLQAHDRARLENVLRDTVIMQTVGNRYEKRLLGRNNVVGQSDEVGRTAAMYGRSVGNAIASIRSGKARSAALARMREIATATKDTQEGGIISQVVNELEQREALDGGPLKTSQALDNLSTINSIDKLASVANWFLNSTQNIMGLLPMLGGEHGNTKAARTIMAAYQKVGAAGALKGGAKNLGKSVTSAGKFALDLEDVIGSIRKNAGPKYNALFDALIARGDIAADVGIENAAQLSSGRSALGLGMAKMDRILRAMPNAIEAVNRSVAAVASYDLAIEQGMSPQEAVDYASQMVRRTQFRYDEVNKSRLMRENKALRFFFTFKQYGQGQYQMLAEAVAKAHRGETLEVRKAAGKQLINLLLVQALTAGVLSVPGIELIKVAVMLGSALGIGDGWDDEVEEVRKMVRDSVGLTWEEVLSKGLLSKALGVDLSSRMSWADLITGFPPENGEKESLIKYFGQTVAGPQGGMLLEWFEGATLFREGLMEGKESDILKGLSLLLPVKVGSDAIKAVRGVESGDMNAYDAAKQVIGFRSLKLAREGDATGAEIRAGKKKKKEVNELISDFYDATSKSDILRATAAIRQYNAGLGEDERQISISGLQKKKLAEARAN